MKNTVLIKNAKNDIDASKRKQFLEKIEQNATTQVLEILSKASSKAGSNEKVIKFKHFL